MVNINVGRRDQDRLRMGEGIKAKLAVITSDTRVADTTKGHRLHEQMYIDLINGAATERQARQEMIDSPLVTTKQESRQRLWVSLHFPNRCVQVFVSKDGKKRAEDLVLHDRIVPSHRIKNRRVNVSSFWIG